MVGLGDMNWGIEEDGTFDVFRDIFNLYSINYALQDGTLFFDAACLEFLGNFGCFVCELFPR